MSVSLRGDQSTCMYMHMNLVVYKSLAELSQVRTESQNVD